MDERRRFVRLHSRFNVKYQIISSGEQFRALAKDTSRSGIGFFTESALKPGTRVEGTVEFPGRPQPVRFKAEVVWSGKLLFEGREQNPRQFEAGVRFIEIAPADLEFLMQRAASKSAPPRSSASS